MSYRLTEVFYSLQGEGGRAGAPSVFVRFAGCNLNCTKESAGFDCDTVHRARWHLEAEDILELVRAEDHGICRWVVLTGGEPLLQVDLRLLEVLHEAKYRIAIETNGTIAIPDDLALFIRYVACSPKRWQEVRLKWADEIRVVLAPGEVPPDPLPLPAKRLYVSPAATDTAIPDAALAWCVKYCTENPKWALSVQQHKIWGIR
jgi:organic radical activating enzyme